MLRVPHNDDLLTIRVEGFPRFRSSVDSSLSQIHLTCRTPPNKRSQRDGAQPNAWPSRRQGLHTNARRLESCIFFSLLSFISVLCTQSSPSIRALLYALPPAAAALFGGGVWSWAMPFSPWLACRAGRSSPCLLWKRWMVNSRGRLRNAHPQSRLPEEETRAHAHIRPAQTRHQVPGTHRPTNSMSDMSAASPGRYRCSFSTRVYPPGRALSIYLGCVYIYA